MLDRLSKLITLGASVGLTLPSASIYMSLSQVSSSQKTRSKLNCSLFSICHSAEAQFGICSQWVLNYCRMIYVICKHIKVPKPQGIVHRHSLLIMMKMITNTGDNNSTMECVCFQSQLQRNKSPIKKPSLRQSPKYKTALDIVASLSVIWHNAPMPRTS